MIRAVAAATISGAYGRARRVIDGSSSSSPWRSSATVGLRAVAHSSSHPMTQPTSTSDPLPSLCERFV